MFRLLVSGDALNHFVYACLSRCFDIEHTAQEYEEKKNEQHL